MNKRDVIKLTLIVCMIIGAAALYTWISHVQDSNETEIVRKAVREAALTCYAVEGAYPDSVEYLREHYRLAYDTGRYYVTYEASLGDNQIPDIWITVKGEKGL